MELLRLNYSCSSHGPTCAEELDSIRVAKLGLSRPSNSHVWLEATVAEELYWYCTVFLISSLNDITRKFFCHPVLLMRVLHPLVLFQALQDEVESYRNQARAAEKKLQRWELETHEQVPAAVSPVLFPWARRFNV